MTKYMIMAETEKIEEYFILQRKKKTNSEGKGQDKHEKKVKGRKIMEQCEH